MIFYKFGLYPDYIFLVFGLVSVWFWVLFFGLRNIVLVWLFINLDLEKNIGFFLVWFKLQFYNCRLVWFKYIGCHIKLYGASILLKWNYF